MPEYQIGQLIRSFLPPGYELSRISFTPGFFDVIYWIPGYQSDQMQSWEHAHLQYGVYEATYIPFCLFHFPAKGWYFDVSLNVYAMQEELLQKWLQQTDTGIHMLLCDCYSNVVLEKRTISIDPYIAAYIRERLKQQKRHYQNAYAVQKQIEHIMDKTTTEEMLKKTSMHKLPSL
jgi:hypothetical protein